MVPAASVLTTPAWNGDTGGVVVMFVRGTFELGGTIDVGGAGFRGGIGATSDICGATTELDPADCAGRKGEGLDGAGWGKLGRGNRANAGGGGNAFNAGAGGGGSGGVGGPGGIECCNMTPGTGGMPGSEIALPVAGRISFGGGGGQGHINSSLVTAGAGGAGGGLAIVHAGSIAGAGSIDAGGRDGMSLDSDGAGGGGAGGTIILRAITSTFTGTLLAQGGRGGDVTDGDSNPDVHGPGGGGGGGHVAIEGVQAAAILVLGGANGTDALDPRGAGPGAEGQIEQQ